MPNNSSSPSPTLTPTTTASTPCPSRTQRTNQLEAQHLDKELDTLLLTQISSAFRFFPSTKLDTFLPELKALLRLFIFANTIAINNPSPGNQHQNLQYSTTHPHKKNKQQHGLSLPQRIALFIVDIGVVYGWDRLRRYMSEESWCEYPVNSWRYVMWRVCNMLEGIVSMIRVINFVLFLVDGKYKSVGDRIMRARLVYVDANATRNMSVEYLNRQLVWEGFAEFMMFFTPVLNADWATRWISNTRLGRRLLMRSEGDDGGGRGVRKNGGGGGRVVKGRGRVCQICRVEPPVMPHYSLPCRHLFCYVCLATAVEDDPYMKCPQCGTPVHEMERYTTRHVQGCVS